LKNDLSQVGVAKKENFINTFFLSLLISKIIRVESANGSFLVRLN
jgi:hypothetical protein